MGGGSTRYGHGIPFSRAVSLARTGNDVLLEKQLGPAQLIGVPPDPPDALEAAEGSEEWSFQTRTMTHGQASMALGIDLSRALVFPVRKLRTTFAGTILVGRSACDVTIDHASISKLHARIQRAGAGYTIRDAGSTNGTWVGGAAVGSAEIALPSAAEVRLGDWALRFYVLSETAWLLRST